VDYLQLDWEIGIGSVGSLSTTLSVIKAGNFFTCELTVSKDNYSSSPWLCGSCRTLVSCRINIQLLYP